MKIVSVQIKRHCKGLLLFLYLSFFSGCNFGAGTLGAFETWHFQVPKKQLKAAIATIKKNNPEYELPESWEDLDNWSERGYDFLESEIFYFKDNPEEMYYVTFVGESSLEDSDQASIAIRAINSGQSKWFLHEDMNQIEIERIEQRFTTEIISKLEMITNTKAMSEQRN